MWKYKEGCGSIRRDGKCRNGWGSVGGMCKCKFNKKCFPC